MSSFFISKYNFRLKIRLLCKFCCCLATMYVSNDQVNINNLIAFMKPWCIQKTYATIDISTLANIPHRLITLPHAKRGQNGDFRGNEHSESCIQILIPSNLVVIKTSYFRHEWVTPMSTFCMTNNSDSSNIFRDMDPLSYFID